MTRSWLVAIACCVLHLPSNASAEFAGELVPAYSIYYEELKLLSTKGLVPPVLLNMRPLTRSQVASALAQGLREDRGRLLDDPVGLRLIREFSVELKALGHEVPVSRQDPFWRIDMSSAGHESSGSSHAPGEQENLGSALSLQKSKSERPASSTTRSTDAKLELSPYLWIRVDNVEPIYFEALADRRLGLNGVFSAGSGAVLLHADLVVGNHSDEPRGIPDFGTLNALIEGEDLNSWLNRGYVRVSTRIADAYYGRDWIRWGPGRTGTLGAGDAAPAHNLFMIRRRMDKVDLATYVSVLDFANEQMVAGHRAELRINPDLTLGLAEQVRFETVGQVPLYLLAFYPYSLVEKIVGKDSADHEKPWRNNVMWTVDVDWVPVSGARVYGEFLLDDWSFSTDKKPTQIGYQVGLVKSGVAGVEPVSVSAEFTKIHRYTYTQARRGGAAADTADSSNELDFVRHDMSLGHPLGPDSEGYFVGMRYDASVSSKWEVSCELRRKGELRLGDGWRYGDPIPDTSSLSGVVETSTRVTAQYTFYPQKWSGSWVSLGGGLRRVTNSDNQEGMDKDWDGIMQASLAFRW